MSGVGESWATDAPWSMRRRPSPTPILLVKGSGKTADLIADLVLLKYGPRHAHHVEAKTAHQLALEHIMKQLLHFNYADDLSTDVRRGDCYRGCIEKLQAVVNELEDIARKEEANQCPRSPAIASSLAERAEDDDEHPRSEVPSGKQRARDLRGGQYVSNSPEQRRADVDQIQRESDAGAGVVSPSSRRHLMSRQHLVSSQHLASSHHLASMAPKPIAVESTNTKSTVMMMMMMMITVVVLLTAVVGGDDCRGCGCGCGCGGSCGGNGGAGGDAQAIYVNNSVAYIV
eukprot:3843295-Rhodomonas_salina.2